MEHRLKQTKDQRKVKTSILVIELKHTAREEMRGATKWEGGTQEYMGWFMGDMVVEELHKVQ